ncbi:MAG: formylglycine-generating enzyme family protein, partial [Acidimicrobiia bacterium]
LIPAGSFKMGWGLREDRWAPGTVADDEVPVHEVFVDSFYIDKYEVTNEQFNEFVESTGYVTDAEKKGGSLVVVTGETEGYDPNWGYGLVWTAGASWRQPDGPGSSIEDRMDHPVVQVSWSDAQAYAAWRGKRLPTEAEWERAARGGLEELMFPWGVTYAEELVGGWAKELGSHMNYNGDIRQDVEWPADMIDGFEYTSASVGSFPGNGYGLYDMAGNVQEYVNDWYAEDYYSYSPSENPQGPDHGLAKVVRGGSWSLCECYGRTASRDPSGPLDSADSSTGFRCALSRSES